jgi:UMF1 family MFS transporter
MVQSCHPSTSSQGHRRLQNTKLDASAARPTRAAAGYAAGVTTAKNDPGALRAWAMYDWANSAYSTVVAGAVLPAFFVDSVVGDSPVSVFGRNWSGESLWALVAGFGPLVMFLIVPVLGAIADFSASKRRFLMFFAVAGSGLTILLFVSAPGRVGATLGLFLLAQMGFVAANVFYDGFLPDLTTDETIDRVSSRGFALGYIGGGLYLLLAVGLIFVAPFGTELTTRIAIGGAGVWWLGFALWAIPRIPETGSSQALPQRLAHLNRTAAYVRVGFGRTWGTARRLLGFPQLLLFVVAFMLYNDGVQTTINVSAAYAGGTLDLDITIIIVAFLIVQFIAYFGALGFAILSDRLGIKRALMISLSVWTAVAIGAFRLPSRSPVPFLLLAAVIGFVLGGTQALSRSLYGSMIPEEASAEFYGFYSVFSKFSAIWGPFLFAFIGEATGSSRNAILSLILFFGVGALLLGRVDIAEARASRSRWAFDADEATTRRLP